VQLQDGIGGGIDAVPDMVERMLERNKNSKLPVVLVYEMCMGLSVGNGVHSMHQYLFIYTGTCAFIPLLCMYNTPAIPTLAIVLLFDENCGCLSIFGTFKLFFR
jgi:hypothetical protein